MIQKTIWEKNIESRNGKWVSARDRESNKPIRWVQKKAYTIRIHKWLMSMRRILCVHGPAKWSHDTSHRLMADASEVYKPHVNACNESKSGQSLRRQRTHVRSQIGRSMETELLKDIRKSENGSVKLAYRIGLRPADAEKFHRKQCSGAGRRRWYFAYVDPEHGNGKSYLWRTENQIS